MRLPLLANNKNKRSVPFGTGLLDTYNTSYIPMALSLRKLRAAQTLCCKVRNDSNAETDIGFAYSATYGGWWIDTAALAAHCGAGSGYISVWYDQTTNGRNFINGTGAAQPKVFSSGSLVTSGGQPSVRFDNNRYLVPSTVYSYPPASAGYGVTMHAVVNADPNGAAVAFLFDIHSGRSRRWCVGTNNGNSRTVYNEGSVWGEAGYPGQPQMVQTDSVADWLNGHHQFDATYQQIQNNFGGFSRVHRDGAINAQDGYAINGNHVFDSANYTYFALGGYASSPSTYCWEGYIGEILFGGFDHRGDACMSPIRASQKAAFLTP